MVEWPLVLGREFIYLNLLVNLVEEPINSVIRMKTGSHQTKFWDTDGREIVLTISPEGTP